MNLVLGSSSKYRRQLLQDAGFEIHSQHSPNINEYNIGLKERSLNDAKNLVLKVAKAKAEALLNNNNLDCILITSDQVIVCNGKIREKPKSEQECIEYLESYSQYPAICYTGICLVNTRTMKIVQDVDVATQYWSKIPLSSMQEAIKQGDVMHCAGGFMIDSPIFEPYLDKREGDASTIIGFSIPLFKKLLVLVQE